MTTPAIVGIDLGTSAVKAVVLDSRGFELGEGASTRGASPVGDPRRWWMATCEAVTSALGAAAKVDQPSVRAVGLSGQMHGLLALDPRGQPIRLRQLLANVPGVPVRSPARPAATGRPA